MQDHGHDRFLTMGTSQNNQFLDETDSLPQSPVDISALQNITAETQKKLQDPCVLLNSDAVYKILLDWVTVLNKTFHSLHIIKYAQSALSHAETVSDLDQKDVSDNQSDSASCVTKSSGQDILSESNEIKSDLKPETDGFKLVQEIEVVPSDNEQVSYQKKEIISMKYEEPGASILKDKDFCYTKDPLFLPYDVFMDVLELAQACFDIGCHGNILQYRSLQVEQSQNKIETNVKSVKMCDEIMTETCANVQDAHATEKYDTTQRQSVVCQGHHAEKCGLCDREICDKHFDSSNLLKNHPSSISNLMDNCSVSDENILQNLSANSDSSSDSDQKLSSKKLQGLSSKAATETSSQQVSVQNTDSLKELNDNLNVRTNKDVEVVLAEDIEIRDKGHQIRDTEEPQLYDCNHCDKDEYCDQEMAFFVRCYFKYLSAVKIRKKTAEYGKCFFQTWCALVTCLQELACDNSERYGVDKDALLQHMIDSLSPGEDGYILLGHISRLFSVKFDNLVSACTHCHPYVQPLDVLFMCSLHGVAIETVFKSYMLQMIQDATRTHRKDTISSLYSHPEVRRTWLDILLAEEGNLQEMVDSRGNPCIMSHSHVWKHQPTIEDIIKQAESKEDKSVVLELCSKYGYWNGCLKILKDFGEDKKQIDLILHLDDVRLFTTRNPAGYLPANLEDWRQLLLTYKDYGSQSSTVAGSQSDVLPNFDGSERITWNSLAVLLVSHLGPSQAVSLLQEINVPESSLIASFYQTCAMAGLVHRHQRLVLHSMLEKIDTYLWAQRPVYSSPQLHYIVVKEKELQGKGSNSNLQENLQRLIQQMKSESDEPQRQYVEDPECHWGVEAKVNLLCPCCNIPLKEPVSLVEPGVLLFRCGHGYHRMCLPERDCFLCTDDTSLKNVCEKKIEVTADQLLDLDNIIEKRNKQASGFTKTRLSHGNGSDKEAVDSILRFVYRKLLENISDK